MRKKKRTLPPVNWERLLIGGLIEGSASTRKKGVWVEGWEESRLKPRTSRKKNLPEELPGGLRKSGARGRFSRNVIQGRGRKFRGEELWYGKSDSGGAKGRQACGVRKKRLL